MPNENDFASRLKDYGNQTVPLGDSSPILPLGTVSKSKKDQMRRFLSLNEEVKQTPQPGKKIVARKDESRSDTSKMLIKEAIERVKNGEPSELVAKLLLQGR